MKKHVWTIDIENELFCCGKPGYSRFVKPSDPDRCEDCGVVVTFDMATASGLRWSPLAGAWNDFYGLDEIAGGKLQAIGDRLPIRSEV